MHARVPGLRIRRYATPLRFERPVIAATNEIASAPIDRATKRRSACVNPLAKTPAADRIAIVRLGAVGDVVRTLPAASRVRAAYPGAHLAWLVEAGAASLLRAQSWIDEVIEIPRGDWSARLHGGRWLSLARDLRRFRATLRAHRFDLVIDFHSILRSGALSATTGAPTRVGFGRPFGRELAHLFATDTASLSPRRIPRFERNDALVDFLAIDAAPAAHPLEVDVGLRAQLLGGRTPVALHPGTSRAARHKRYPVAGFAALARRIHAATGQQPIVTWGPGGDDRALAQGVVDASAGAAQLAPATPGLPELAALLSGCRLLVAADSGPLHVASLVATPVVQVLGPTHPVENAPYSDTPSRSVRHALGCSPCRRGCASATCMRIVPPGELFDVAMDLLGAPR